jgi:hypothetical protein
MTPQQTSRKIRNCVKGLGKDWHSRCLVFFWNLEALGPPIDRFCKLL